MDGRLEEHAGDLAKVGNDRLTDIVDDHALRGRHASHFNARRRSRIGWKLLVRAA